MTPLLVVVDLDKTLIDTLHAPLSGPEHTIMIIDGKLGYVYLRPFAGEFLCAYRSDPNVTLVLFSAGSFDYVYGMVDQIVLPAAGDGFYFDWIYTRDDLNARGEKDLNWLRQKHGIEKVILIDDSWPQCLSAANRGCEFCYIPEFNALDPDWTRDAELFFMMCDIINGQRNGEESDSPSLQ